MLKNKGSSSLGVNFKYKVIVWVYKALRTPVGGQEGGGSIWTQHQKHTFVNEFCVEIWVAGKVLQKTPNAAKKSKIGRTVSNGGQ